VGPGFVRRQASIVHHLDASTELRASARSRGPSKPVVLRAQAQHSGAPTGNSKSMMRPVWRPKTTQFMIWDFPSARFLLPAFANNGTRPHALITERKAVDLS